jgi:hypothetical protein
MGLQITAFQPNLVAFFERDWNEAFLGVAHRGFCFVPCFSDLSEAGSDVRDLGFFN